MPRIITALFVAIFFVTQFSGCSGPDIEVAEVTGTVVSENGEPLPGLKIMFCPDPNGIPPEQLAAGRGQPSTAITDDNGKYRLKYRGPSHEFGAEIGRHLITVIDILLEDSRDDPIPPRINEKYAVGSLTDLSCEIKSSDEEIVHDIKLDGP